MKKEYILGILFFSALWGISEAVLGNALYTANVPYSSVPLTVIGFVILTFARVYLAQRGTAVLIAVCATLYKFLNAPFFACHLLGIVLLGVGYEVLFSKSNLKNRAIRAAAAVYFGYASFALMITYVFRYDPWVQAGFSKVLSFVGIGGSIAALGCAVFVPLSFHFAERLKAKVAVPFGLRLRLATAGVPLVTTGLWVFSVAVFFIKI